MSTLIDIYRCDPDSRHYDDGWTEADCSCGWSSWGANAEPVTEEAVAEHLTEAHPRRYKRSDFWTLVNDYT